MKTVRYIFLFVLLIECFAVHLPVVAQSEVESNSLELEVYFRRGYSVFDRNFENNGARMDEFIQHIGTYLRDSLCYIKSIQIVGTASPEGNVVLNQRLAERRAATVRALLCERIPEIEPITKATTRGVDWSGLAEYLRTSDLPHRDQMLNIIENTPEVTYREGKPRESRKLQLVYLNDGADWRYLLNNVFPKLRRGVSMIIERRIEPLPPVEPVVTPEPEPEPVVAPVEPEVTPEPEPVVVPAEPKKRIPWLAIKSNLLSDVALVPNVGIEACLGNRVSMGVNWSYSRWKSDNANWYWQTYGGDVNIRYWLGKRSIERRLTGHHIGLYGQMSTFDYEAGNRGIQAPHWVYGAGLEYGYSMPVGRRLNIDFTLGAGYISGEFYEYVPMDTHYVWQATKSVPPFSLTKAEVALTWLIGRDRGDSKAGKAEGKRAKNKKKGGER